MAPLQTPTDGSRLRSEYNQETLQRDTEDWKEHQGALGELPTCTRLGGSSLPANHNSNTSQLATKTSYSLLAAVFLLLLCHVVQSQSLGFFFVGDSGETAFSDSGSGVYALNPAQSFYVYSYLNPDGGSYFLRAYNDAGTIVGSFTRPGDQSDGVAMLTSTRFVVAPKSSYNYMTIEAQSISTGSVSFVLVSSRTNTAAHTTTPPKVILEEPNTDFIYLGQERLTVTLVRDNIAVAKMSTAISTLTTSALYSLTASNTYQINSLEPIDGNSILAAGGNLLTLNFYVVLSRSSLTEIFNIKPSSHIYASKVEPLDTTLVYLGRKDAVVAKATLSTGTSLNEINLPNPVSNMMRPTTYSYLIVTNINGTSELKLINLSAFSLVMSFSITGFPANLSLVLGQFAGNKNQYLSVVNLGNKRVQSYIICADYCQTTCQRNCAACQSGRYLSANTNDNNCLLPSEFPAAHGHDGTYMQPCLGSLTSGCTSCPTTYLTCAACDLSSGFYLYPAGATCYKVSTMPDTLGVNNGASPKVVTSCSDSNCLKCASDHTQCTQCKPSWYLKSPSSGGCFENNIASFGPSTTAAVPTLVPCSTEFCGVCATSSTSCDTCIAGKYLKSGSSVVCYSNNLDEFGLNGSNVLVSCSDSNCKNCYADFGVCTLCKGAYLVDEVGNTCKTTAAGKGNDGAGYLRACTLSNCISCAPDRTKCQVCGSGFVYDGTACVAGATPLGPDQSNGNILTPCTVVGCGKCDADHTICQSCASGFYFPEGSTASCELNDQDYAGLKPDGGGGFVIASCQVVNCRSCLQDYQKCEVCDGSRFPKEPMRTSCELNNVPNYGIKTLPSSTQVLDVCSDTNCDLCYANHVECFQCKPNFYQKVGQELANPSCFSATIIGFGLINSTPPKLMPCSTANCRYCQSDYNTCTECSDGYFRQENLLNTCVQNSKAGFGLKSMTEGSPSIISSCLVQSCGLCFSDHTKCEKCNEPLLYNSSSNTCVQNNIPGFGKLQESGGAGIIVPCLISNCANCFQDYKQCIACTESFKLTVSGSCSTEYKASQEVEFLQPIYFIVSSSSFVVEFKGNIDPVSDIANKFRFVLRLQGDRSIVDPSKYSVTLEQTNSYQLSGTVKPVGENLVDKSDLEIYQAEGGPNKVVLPVVKNSTHSMSSSSFIKVTGVVVVPSFSAALAQSGSTITKVLGAVLTVSSAAGLSASAGGPNQLSAMLKIIDNVEYVLFINGKRIYRSDTFLGFWSKDIMQIFDNYFFTEERNLECIPHESFARHNLSCSFLNNYGSEMLTIFILCGLFALSEGMTFLSKSLKKRGKSRTIVVRVVDVINYVPSKMFNSEFMITLLDGSQIQILRQASLNFYNFNSTPGMIGAAIVSALFVLIYCWFAVKTYQCVSKMIKDHINMSLDCSSPRISPRLDSPRRSPDQSKDLGSQECGESPIQKEVFQGFKELRVGESRLYLYIPLMFLGKSAVMELWIILTYPTHVIQLWVIFFIEAAYFATISYFRPFKKWRPQVWMLVSAFSLTMIAGINLLVNYHGSTLTFEEREDLYGPVLISLYSVCILTAITPGIVDSLISLYGWIKTKCQARSSNKDKEKTNKVRPGGNMLRQLDKPSLPGIHNSLDMPVNGLEKVSPRQIQPVSPSVKLIDPPQSGKISGRARLKVKPQAGKVRKVFASPDARKFKITSQNPEDNPSGSMRGMFSTTERGDSPHLRIVHDPTTSPGVSHSFKFNGQHEKISGLSKVIPGSSLGMNTSMRRMVPKQIKLSPMRLDSPEVGNHTTETKVSVMGTLKTPKHSRPLQINHNLHSKKVIEASNKPISLSLGMEDRGYMGNSKDARGQGEATSPLQPAQKMNSQ